MPKLRHHSCTWSLLKDRFHVDCCLDYAVQLACSSQTLFRAFLFFGTHDVHSLQQQEKE